MVRSSIELTRCLRSTPAMMPYGHRPDGTSGNDAPRIVNLVTVTTPDPHQTTPGGKPRARALGIPFGGRPGRWNAITDVPGVEVGYTTLIKGSSVRTGGTAIHRRGPPGPGRGGFGRRRHRDELLPLQGWLGHRLAPGGRLQRRRVRPGQLRCPPRARAGRGPARRRARRRRPDARLG